jgi:hypothetical protein
MIDNRKELDALVTKLDAIVNIVRKYIKHGVEGALRHRIESFCEYVNIHLLMALLRFTVSFQRPS